MGYVIVEMSKVETVGKRMTLEQILDGLFEQIHKLKVKATWLWYKLETGEEPDYWMPETWEEDFGLLLLRRHIDNLIEERVRKGREAR